MGIAPFLKLNGNLGGINIEFIEKTTSKSTSNTVAVNLEKYSALLLFYATNGMLFIPIDYFKNGKNFAAYNAADPSVQSARSAYVNENSVRLWTTSTGEAVLYGIPKI